MSAPLISISNLSLTNNGNHILSGIDWAVERGRHWLLFGPNGSGKTCLLKVITGYDWADLGSEIEVFGERFGHGAHIPTLRKRIGWVSTALAGRVHGHLTAAEVAVAGIDAAMRLFREYSGEEQEQALEALRLLGAGHLSERLYDHLSQGERQRVLVARALVDRPEILILDEACAGLDPGAREDFLDDLSGFVQMAGAPTVIFVTHHLEEIRPFLTYALVLDKGRVVAKGPIAGALTSEVLSAINRRKCVVTHSAGRFQLSIGPLAENERLSRGG